MSLTPEQLRGMADWLDADETKRGPPPPEFHGFDDAKILRAHAYSLERLAELERELSEAREECERKQAQIDALMLEYCPDEMTEEQLANWGKHQRPLSKEESAEMDATMKGSK